jgi:hypothetical protein
MRACGELGITGWPRIVRVFGTEQEKRTHSRQINLARRHLTQQQRRDLIAADLKDRPERSNRRVAADLGVDHKTVGAVRDNLEAGGEIPQLKNTVGSTGKSYPAKRPKIVEISFGDLQAVPLPPLGRRGRRQAQDAYLVSLDMAVFP